MRLLLNVIWFVFAGVWMAIGYAFAALIMFILIITIPFGVAALRIGIFALWPFGKTVVRRADAGAGSAIGNILWFLLAGWWLMIGQSFSSRSGSGVGCGRGYGLRRHPKRRSAGSACECRGASGSRHCAKRRRLHDLSR